MQERYNALILAGFDPEKPDPLTVHERQPHKALLDVCGKPMIWHVVNALHNCPRVGEIAIVGLNADCGVTFECEVHFLESRGNMVDNGLHGLDFFAQRGELQQSVLVATADTPLLTWQAVTWFLDACRPADQEAYWGIVRRESMDAAFPGNKRTYLRTMQGQFCSGDLFLVKIPAARRVSNRMSEFMHNRKHLLLQLRSVGLLWVVRLLFGRINLWELVAALRQMISGTGTVVILPFPGPGMDVDKPHQLTIVRAYMAAQLATLHRS
jgi:hypothetical protein